MAFSLGHLAVSQGLGGHTSRASRLAWGALPVSLGLLALLRGLSYAFFSLFFFAPTSYPKDPAVLKTLRDSELLRRSVFTTPPRFTTP